jgi:hypothetical protein
MPNDQREINYLTFPGLSRSFGGSHAVFTRHGGVSEPPYGSLNVALTNGDRPSAVAENLRRVREAAGFGRLVSCRQVHGTDVVLVDEKTLAAAGSDRPVLHLPATADILVTRLTDIGLLIKVADCQPVFLADPETGVAANVHCGWRGSVRNVIGRTVRYLVERCGCRPESLRAAVGPSLGPCCAEFRNYQEELPESFYKYQARPTYFDFWAISRDQLQAAGVLEENVEIAGRCTVCESGTFFSYRAERNTGRNAAVIGRPEPGGRFA